MRRNVKEKKKMVQSYTRRRVNKAIVSCVDMAMFMTLQRYVVKYTEPAYVVENLRCTSNKVQFKNNVPVKPKLQHPIPPSRKYPGHLTLLFRGRGI